MKRFLVCVLFVWTTIAYAGWPEKQVTIVVPFGPGGGNDLIARRVSERLSVMWKVPVVIENKPGADTVIGSKQVASAEPDGYTLLSSSFGVLAVASATQSDTVGFDWQKDFVTVGFFGFAPPFVVVTSSKNNVTTLNDLRQFAETRKGLTFATVGGPFIIYGELVANALSVKGINVPYRTSPQATLDTINGDVDYLVTSPAAAVPHIQSGRLKALAVVGDQPSALLPNVPTTKSLGLTKFPNIHVTYSLIAPSGTPVDIQRKIRDDVAQAVASISDELIKSRLIDDARAYPKDPQAFAYSDGVVWKTLAEKYIKK